jgi:hypothetical protein
MISKCDKTTHSLANSTGKLYTLRLFVMIKVASAPRINLLGALSKMLTTILGNMLTYVLANKNIGILISLFTSSLSSRSAR